MDKLLSNREAATYCGIPLRTWQSYYLIWGVPHFRIGRSIKFRLSELDAWVESKRELIV